MLSELALIDSLQQVEKANARVVVQSQVLALKLGVELSVIDDVRRFLTLLPATMVSHSISSIMEEVVSNQDISPGVKLIP